MKFSTRLENELAKKILLHCYVYQFTKVLQCFSFTKCFIFLDNDWYTGFPICLPTIWANIWANICWEIFCNLFHIRCLVYKTHRGSNTDSLPSDSPAYRNSHTNGNSDSRHSLSSMQLLGFHPQRVDISSILLENRSDPSLPSQKRKEEEEDIAASLIRFKSH